MTDTDTPPAPAPEGEYEEVLLTLRGDEYLIRDVKLWIELLEFHPGTIVRLSEKNELGTGIGRSDDLVTLLKAALSANERLAKARETRQSWLRSIAAHIDRRHHMNREIADLRSRLAEATKALKDEVERVAEVVLETGGWWAPCAGCHETVEGYETGHYRYDSRFQCHAGSGCCDCGGIGVVWNNV